MIFNIPSEHISALIDAKIPLECVFILERLINGEEFDGGRFHQTLLRKGYVDIKGNVTKFGQQLYDSMFQPVGEIKSKKRPVAREKNTDFETWWELYPATNYFEYNGRTFKGTQSKHKDQEGCRKLFTVYTTTEYTAEQIIEATRVYIDTAKELSFKKSENQLNFIKNSYDFLSQKVFIPFIGKAKAVAPDGDLTVNISI